MSTKNDDRAPANEGEGAEAGPSGRRAVVVHLPAERQAIVILGPPGMGVGYAGTEKFTKVELFMPTLLVNEEER